MSHRKPTHPITADMRREISVAALAKAGAFKRPMRFPFQHLETARDHIRVFRVGDKTRQTPQTVAVQWRQNDVRHEAVFYLPALQCKARFSLSRRLILLLSDLRRSL